MTKLYVGSLPYSITDESLLQLFTEKGYRPVSARAITDRPGPGNSVPLMNQVKSHRASFYPSRSRTSERKGS